MNEPQLTQPELGQPDIGWVRAIGTGLAIVVIGFAGAVFLPNLIVVQLGGVSSFIRSLLATALTVVVVIAMAWTLRRLQQRRIV